MTIVVGVVSGRSVTLGADRRRTSGTAIIPFAGSKVWRQGPCIFGLTGSDRESQLVRHATTIPDAPDGDLMRWLVVDVANAMRAARKANGYDEKSSDGTDAGPLAMVGVRGRLFVVYPDYQVGEFESYAAIGSGEPYAAGSLATTAGLNWSGRRRVLAALEAACLHDSGCAPPFDLMMCRARSAGDR